MTAEGKVRSEPAKVSATDCMLDAMRMSAARRSRHESERASNRPNASLQQREQQGTYDAFGLDWTIPRSLGELIEIRATLLRREWPRD